ncbi:transmembrane protein 174-like [Salmo trutta]|uniref:transmembrane protein 174-like n=1 Tax=Salmo trutta TaxID=8032 RepID=UPI0011325731|nr:transmembrane protein 174-like [Salmo trutta]
MAVTAANVTGTFDDLSLKVVPISIGSIPYLSQLDSHVSVSDGEKRVATFLFSGIFLDLVGMTFIVMGWLKYDVSRSFDWTQLLDPILLSVGGTFILISVCMFRMLSCRVCKPKDHAEEFSESLAIAGSCQSIVFNGINQPIMFYRATVVQYIQAPYEFVTQEVNPSNVFQPNVGSANGVPRTLPPQYFTVCPLGNPAFIGDNKSPPNNNCRQDGRHSR